jgi:hypothetical protein
MAASCMQAFKSLPCRYNVRLRALDSGTHRDKIAKLHFLKAEDAVARNRHESGSKLLERKTEVLSPLPTGKVRPIIRIINRNGDLLKSSRELCIP